jgi:hypothetical protein
MLSELTIVIILTSIHSYTIVVIILTLIHSYLIGDEGAKSLATMLLTNTTLKTLVIANNKIGQEGGIALGKSFGQNKNNTLETLYCGGNSIGMNIMIILM